MDSWINNLPLELQIIKTEEFIDPVLPIEDSETILGEFTEDEKRLFTLLANYTKSGAKLLVELQFQKTSGKDQEDLKRLSARHKILGEIFWYTIRESHHLFTLDIGIREGFLIVELPKGSDSVLTNLKDLLSNL